MDIYVYTTQHEELLARELSAGVDAAALARAAVWVKNDLDFDSTKKAFANFLQESNYLYFDGFVRICLDD